VAQHNANIIVTDWLFPAAIHFVV